MASVQAGTAFQRAFNSGTHVGMNLTPQRHAITPELVRWYAAAMDDDNPWYSGRSPFGGPVAPPLILHNLAYIGRRLNEWYLPNRFGNLHAKQAWEFFQPVMVGDTVTSRALITERYRRRDREFVACEAWTENESGHVLARVRSVQSFMAEPERGGVVVDRSKEKQAARRFDLADGPVLERLEGKRRVISEEDCDRVTGETRNYHNDLEESKKLGFSEIVVQGAYITCFISQMMTERYGEGWLMGGRMALTFVNPLWVGEGIAAGGVVRELIQEGPLQRAHLDVWTAKDDGTRTIVGTASALQLP